MATLAASDVTAVQKERAFFFYMSLAIAVNVVAGFVFFLAIGQSSFGAPWWVHVHAVTMMGWVGLYVTQNFLVWRGQLANHRQLGLLVAAWSVWMVPVGLAVTAMNVHTHRSPPFFAADFFLAMDWLNIVVFAGLVWTAVRLRQRSDWHKRLMLGGMITLMGPGVGRLLPLPLLRENVIWAILLVQLVYFAIAMLYDRRTQGRVHPAWYWGLGLQVAFALLINPLAALPPFQALVQSIAG